MPCYIIVGKNYQMFLRDNEVTVEEISLWNKRYYDLNDYSHFKVSD